ncbi:MAG: hypothetical protein HYT14_01055 [Candidatus Liptonbacteria bacterium]|nr:hypothetical protein [Candidatus Liptonbacteria bacterium]
MIERMHGSLLRFLATPLGFNLYAMAMCTDPALLALSVVGVQRTVNFLITLV